MLLRRFEIRDEVLLERSPSAIRTVSSGRYGRFERYACCAGLQYSRLSQWRHVNEHSDLHYSLPDDLTSSCKANAAGKCNSSVCEFVSNTNLNVSSPLDLR